MPEPDQLVRRRLLVQRREGGGTQKNLSSDRETSSTMLSLFTLASGDSGETERAQDLSVDQQGPFSEDIATCDASSLGLSGQASSDCSLHTPKKTATAGSKPRTGDGVRSGSGSVPSAPPAMMPRTPLTATAEKVRCNAEVEKRVQRLVVVMPSRYCAR